MIARSRSKTEARLNSLFDTREDPLHIDGFPDKDVEQYLRHFYERVPSKDIMAWSDEEIIGAAASLWHLAKSRKPGEISVRVFNPDIETHGWQCRYTVVEIVADDMPFIVDSVSSELNKLDHTVHLSIHPVFVPGRKKNVLESLMPPKLDTKSGKILHHDAVESFIHIRIDRQSDPKLLKALAANLQSVMQDVALAVADWMPTREKALEAVEEIGTLAGRKTGPGKQECKLAQDFLRWVEDNHFTFLGYRQYKFEGTGKDINVTLDEKAGLGILRDAERPVFGGVRKSAGLPKMVIRHLREPELLLVTKANELATVHRPVHMDAIIIRRFDAKGNVVGAHLFLGLFTSVAYSRSPFEIPYLKEKVTRVIEVANYPHNSHDGKALVHILVSYPRDELFQITEEELLDTATGILDLQERRRTALFIRQDPFERFYMALVYVPRDDYDTALRERLQGILEDQLGAECVDFYTTLDISPLARVHFVMKTVPGECQSFDHGLLERSLAEAARSWIGHLEEVLIDEKGEEEGRRLMRRYDHAFPSGYRDRLPAQLALYDITRMERMLETDEIQLSLYRPISDDAKHLRFKIYHRDTPVSLYEVLPMMENMGLRVTAEVPWDLRLQDRNLHIWIHDFECCTDASMEVALTEIRDLFHEAFHKVWKGKLENDPFNGLVLGAALHWREVVILRAYAKYLRQARFQFSQSAIARTLLQHPQIARMIVSLFHAYHDPNLAADQRQNKAAVCEDEITKALDAVTNIDDDTILSRFVTLVKATLRTNFYQRDENGEEKDYVSFKLDSHAVPELPLPRPMVEIFVYSPRVEAVHLRGGKVARGGIRWSDRREDFRTEILGLMKAQMVKNAVIVPVGAKGGFVVKHPPPPDDRDAFLKEGIACYKIMVRGLLDVTDNRADTKIIPPKDVLRRDKDDPYLVVAADKGTATFSDIANGISQEYGFWLDDAFASGGSSGYDHKAMGITARGAWESVKRHFRETGKDIQREDFTVIGVGDMAGDVFGNGMLLSEHIRLIGAFNHKHIFCDPAPDAAKSFKERKRLFETPGSQWSDYSEKLLSKGGKIFERSAKKLKLTTEIKSIFGIKEDEIAPNALIRAMLLSEVELLWFGGIGTYVKSSRESHEDVGDKANDVLRVDARDIRAKIVGEGANLGVTQLARIEYARTGGRINTDFIDNSAGVDTSDHEVNIKILLNKAVAEGDLTLKQRNALLVKMEDEVASLVLRDNYLQTAALSLSQATAVERLDSHARYMRLLVREGLLNREVEYLPNDEEIEERARLGEGLTRPELSVLLAYAKIALYDELLAKTRGRADFGQDALIEYFPQPLREKCGERIQGHQLAPEIVATQITNSLVNRMGPVFISEMMEKTGHDMEAIVRAYAVARNVFGLKALWRDIEALDGQVPGDIQIAMVQRSVRLVERSVPWFLAHLTHPINVDEASNAMRKVTGQLAGSLGKVLTPSERKTLNRRITPLKRAGVPQELAERVAGLPLMASAPYLAEVSDFCNRKSLDVAKVYFLVGQRFCLQWMRDRIQELGDEDHWQRQASDAIMDDMFAHQANLTMEIMQQAPDDLTGASVIEWWTDARQHQIERVDQLIEDLQAAPQIDLAMLAVANGHLRQLAE